MKKLFKLGFVALLAAMVLGFGGCSDDTDSPSESHTHTYATTWTYDATHHWKE